MQFFVELQFTTQNETQNMVYKHLLVIFLEKAIKRPWLKQNYIIAVMFND